MPEAFAGIVAGLTITFVSLVGYSAMAGAICGGGLGDLGIRYGYQRFLPEVMLLVKAIGLVSRPASRIHSRPVASPFLAGAFRGDLVVLQGNLNGETTLSIMKYAKQLGMIVAFNPSPLQAYFADLWPLVDIAFVNEGEASSLTGLQGEAASAALLALGVDLVVQTNGAEGALLTARNVSSRVSASKCEVVDTTGAGDTFMAVALASSMLRRAKLDPSAVESASLAASLTVSRLGTLSAFPTREELATILAQT